MAVLQHCDITYRLDGVTHKGSIRINQEERKHGTEYQAVIENTPLHGTYGAFADTIELAIDFLNLAMQAEGADNISVACGQVSQ